MKTRIILALTALVALTSCEGLTQVTVPQSNINFVGKDFETERFVEYTLTKSYVFGIGGMSSKARNTNIIRELMKKAELQKNEALAYITISKKQNTFLGLVTTVDFVASGYVVRPVGEYPDRKPTYKDTPYKGAFQGKDSVVEKYETKGGMELVKELRKKIYGASNDDELYRIKEDIVLFMEQGDIDQKSGKRLINTINGFLLL